ncbi:MAG: GNAT family N-acetyltransferase [Oscillospiraceae bacterium]
MWFQARRRSGATWRRSSAGLCEQRRAGTDFVYAITLKGSSEFIGVASLHHVPAPVPELGIWTKMEAHGHHYGREAIGAMLRLAASMGIGRLCYPVDRRNVPSRKSRCITAGGGQTRSVWCVRRTAGRSKRNDTKSKPEAGRPSCVEQRRAAGLLYGKVERFYSFFVLRKFQRLLQ